MKKENFLEKLYKRIVLFLIENAVKSFTQEQWNSLSDSQKKDILIAYIYE